MPYRVRTLQQCMAVPAMHCCNCCNLLYFAKLFITIINMESEMRCCFRMSISPCPRYRLLFCTSFVFIFSFSIEIYKKIEIYKFPEGDFRTDWLFSPLVSFGLYKSSFIGLYNKSTSLPVI